MVANGEHAAGEGMLDAQAFCKALLPCLQFLDDFDAAARAYSSCLGTRDLGGDLGEIERGQMHPAIEAVLFDPEVEFGRPLGPVETNAGLHLLWAQQKNQGILSTTVRASHILVSLGLHEAPAEEESIVLTTAASGEEGSDEGEVRSSWKLFSYSLSLPPALAHPDEAQIGALSELQNCRTALRQQRSSGLRLLFRWAHASIFSVKGVLSDVPRDVAGSIQCLVAGKEGGGGTPRYRHVGELLASEDVEVATGAVTFLMRLRWNEEGWQDADGLVDAEGTCNLHVELRRKHATATVAAKKPATTLRLRAKPTLLAYAASQPGLRLALCSGESRHARCATLVRALEDGKVVVRVDNVAPGEEEVVDPRPLAVLKSPIFACQAGQRLLLAHKGGLVDATVQSQPGPEAGNRHCVLLQDGCTIEVDLNETNHCDQRFDSIAAFEAARLCYLQQLIERGRFIEDAITGNCLSVTEQLVRIKMETRESQEGDAAAVARMPFDDLEWVPCSEVALRDRVWAQGREGYVDQLHRSGQCVVRLSDGSTTPPLAPDMLKKASPIAGVQSAPFAAARDISGLVHLLLAPSPGRMQGVLQTHRVLLRAGPGTGKTWSMQQLLFLLASALTENGATGVGGDPVHLVPLLIPVQKLARLLRQRQSTADACQCGIDDSNLVLFYIRQEIADAATRDMLIQAFEMRALIVLLDGVDEAANVKQIIEDFVTQTLVPFGLPLLVTSRPEGIRKRLYARDFVIMNLEPLSPEEQHQIAATQLRGNPFFKHLSAMATLDRQLNGDEPPPKGMPYFSNGEGVRQLCAKYQQEHREFFRSRMCPSEGEAAFTDENFAEVLDLRLQVFNRINEVPVLLSVLVCALSDERDQLPRDTFELYAMGVEATVRRHFGCGGRSEAATAAAATRADEVADTLRLLRLIATANHLAKRRTFQPSDVRKALSGAPDKAKLLALWSTFLTQGEVPLVKILTLGDSGGEFQFRHLSFQEYFFGLTLTTERRALLAFFGCASQLCSLLNEPFYHNAFTLCRGHLGRALAEHRPNWNLDCQPRLSSLGAAALRHMLARASALQGLDLSNIRLDAAADMETLLEAVSGPGLPNLERLCMRCCQLPPAAAASLGTLLSLCPNLSRLDLEHNRGLLRRPEAAEALAGQLPPPGNGGSLHALRQLSLRWCQVPGAVGPSLGSVLARFPGLAEVDLLGSRHLKISDLVQPSSKVRLKGLAADCPPVAS